jgi:hypothetical protein
MAAGVLGARFPTVHGIALSHDDVVFPDDLAGDSGVLLVGFRRGMQADMDQWLDYLWRNSPDLHVYEVPCMLSNIWRPVIHALESAMRAIVPHRLWPKVVNVYDHGCRVRDFIGDNGSVHAHVILIDAKGIVRWFDADGFSDEGAAELISRLAALSAQARATAAG